MLNSFPVEILLNLYEVCRNVHDFIKSIDRGFNYERIKCFHKNLVEVEMECFFNFEVY